MSTRSLVWPFENCVRPAERAGAAPTAPSTEQVSVPAAARGETARVVTGRSSCCRFEPEAVQMAT